MKTKTLKVMLDADGCFFGADYHCINFYIIYKYDDRISRLTKDAINLMAVKELIDDIIRDVTEKYRNPGDFFEEKIGISEAKMAREIFEKYQNQKPKKQDEADIIVIALINKFREVLNNFVSEDKRLQTFILEIANELLIANICEQLRGGRFTHFSLVSGSSRQTEWLDEKNSEVNGTIKFNTAIQLLQEIFNKRKDQEKIPLCDLDKFLLSNFYMTEEDTHYDTTKFTLHYAIFQRAAKMAQNAEDEIIVLSIDDKDEIQTKLIQVFGQNCVFIPRGMSFGLCSYDGLVFEPWARDDQADKPFYILGTGDIDHNYVANIKYLAETSRTLTSSVDVATTFIDNPMKLKAFHQKRQPSYALRPQLLLANAINCPATGNACVNTVSQRRSF